MHAVRTQWLVHGLEGVLKHQAAPLGQTEMQISDILLNFP